MLAHIIFVAVRLQIENIKCHHVLFINVWKPPLAVTAPGFAAGGMSESVCHSAPEMARIQEPLLLRHLDPFQRHLANAHGIVKQILFQ